MRLNIQWLENSIGQYHEIAKVQWIIYEGRNDFYEKIFLSTLSGQFPESGIAERYKRLGISVRQGQKVKNKTLKDELIKEHTETIRTGRIKIIRLIEKGRSFLSKNRWSNFIFDLSTLYLIAL